MTAPASARNPPVSLRTPPVKVFVVDDDPIILECVREWLETAGYSVETREQALGTANWVANGKPAFVILDVNMPALSGSELAQLMRRTESTSAVGVILHSSMDSEHIEELARSTGAIGAIAKTSRGRLFLAQFERLVVQHRVRHSRI